jgi:predicted DCC family thiol-disulfide oxidoreductase YuxK
MTDADRVLEGGPVLLYDGSCGVCSWAVQWVLHHERESTLRFAPLEGAVGRQLRERAGVASDVDSLLWVEAEDGKVKARKYSSAALRVIGYVGGPWRLLSVFWLVPSFVRDAAYRAFAHVRYRVVAQSCLLPTPAERARFVGSPNG